MWLVAFSLVGSAACRFLRLDAGLIAPVTSFLTILVGVYAVFGDRIKAVWPVLLLGVFSEILGLYTGFPFGRYEYTDQWIPTISLPQGHQFPLILPFAWVLVAGASWAVSPFLGWRRWLWTGVLAALIDLPMEAVMTGALGYWRWLSIGPLPGGAPVSNFLGWVLVGSLAGVLLDRVEGVRREDGVWVLVCFAVLVAGLGFIN